MDAVELGEEVNFLVAIHLFVHSFICSTHIDGGGADKEASPCHEEAQACRANTTAPQMILIWKMKG